MFADVKELRHGAALEQQTRLREAAAAILRPQHGNSNTLRPPQAHISPSRSSQANLSDSSCPYAPPHGTGATGSHSNPTTAGSGTAFNLPASAPNPQYVLLCVNTRRLRTLEHVEVPTARNDEFLFDALRESYNLARKSHVWTLPLLPHFVPISNWLRRYVGDLSLLAPTSADYVRVCLFQISP